MYRRPNLHPCPYYSNNQMDNSDDIYNNANRCPYLVNIPVPQQLYNQYNPYSEPSNSSPNNRLKDYGPEPFVINIEEATIQNNTFRTALWTGSHMQLTLMSIKVGEDIGLEMHPDVDQFIRIEQGQGLVLMGDTKERPNFQANVQADFIIMIPAGKWHNLINTGRTPLKLYSIYAPPQHPHGTVHATKAIAQAAEEGHD